MSNNDLCVMGVSCVDNKACMLRVAQSLNSTSASPSSPSPGLHSDERDGGSPGGRGGRDAARDGIESWTV